MFRSLIAIAALALASLTLMPLTAQAAPVTPKAAQSEGGLVVKVQRRIRYCMGQRVRCTRRWGLGTRRYRACIRRAGCGIGVYSCRKATLICTQRFRRNTPLWQRCMRRRGC